jgi:hypothetical protein
VTEILVSVHSLLVVLYYNIGLQFVLLHACAIEYMQFGDLKNMFVTLLLHHVATSVTYYVTLFV